MFYEMAARHRPPAEHAAAFATVARRFGLDVLDPAER